SERGNSTSGRLLPRHAAALCRRYMAYFSTAAYKFQSGDKDLARVDKAEPLQWLKAGWFRGIREGQMSQ
ncbi:hypothetical protein, partial [Acidiphilium multivorum]|uniref:hypothetical protein n=1 Tax=Acidiphilium multivorum TaxID=62140 RepID=UPI001B8B24BD